MEDYNRTGGIQMSRRTETMTAIITLEVEVEVELYEDSGNYLQPPESTREWKLLMKNSELNDLVNAKIEEQVNEYDFD